MKKLTLTESERIKKLRESLIKEIPRTPNDRQSLLELESKSLPDLLVIYANWIARYITPRKRDVIIEQAALSDLRWATLAGQIYQFLEKVKSGEDLTPHLSLIIRKKGFSPAATKVGQDVDKWEDKDFLLNVMGYHHFHLGNQIAAKDHVGRTDDVLFAEVTRDKFRVIAIFSHSVFEKNTIITPALTDERKRLWEIFDEHSLAGATPGSLVIPSIIMTSGHSFKIVRLAQDYMRVIKEIDPKLDDYNFVKDLFAEAEISLPKKYKLNWHFRFLDLGVFDNASKTYFVFRYGVN